MDTNRDENDGESQDNVNRRGDIGTAVGDPLPSQRHLGHQQGHYAATDIPQQDLWGASGAGRAPGTEHAKHVSVTLPNRTQTEHAQQSSPPPHSSGNTTTATTPTSTTTGCSSDSTGGDAHSPSHVAHSAPATIPESAPSSGSITVGPQIPIQGPNPPIEQEPWSQNIADNIVQSTSEYGQPPGSSIEYPRSDSAPASFGQRPTLERQGSSNAEFSCAIKLLVSNNVAGSIIGRSGQTIIELQSQSSTRIKLSQSGDYYPGTQDRVCLIQGNPENVKKATSVVLTRLFALQQQQHYHHFPWQGQPQQQGQQGLALAPDSSIALGMPGSTEDPGMMVNPSGGPPTFAFVVRLVVPVPCCGMIIGKGGTNVKHMVESSGVSAVRLSPKEGTSAEATAAAAMISATSERAVTITGPDLESCIKCMFIILDGMASHPDISRYANMTTSYSRVLSAAHAAQAAVAAASVHGAAPAGSGAAAAAGNRHTPDSSTQPYGVDTSNPNTMGIWDRQQQERQGAVPPPSSMIPTAGAFDSLHLSQSMFQDRAMDVMGASSAPTSPHLRARENLSSYHASPVFGAPASAGFLQGPQRDVPPSPYSHSPRRPMPGPSPPSSQGAYLIPPSQPQSFQGQPGMIGGENIAQAGASVTAATPAPAVGAGTGVFPVSTSAPDLLALQMQDALRVSADMQQQQHQSFLSSGGGMVDSSGGSVPTYPTSGHPSAQLSASGGSPQSTTNPGGVITAQVAIPDSLIGSILGRGGRTLNELMMLSNTKIRISQRGEYVPGTKNRIVTIRGATTQSVSTAQFLMSQRMVIPPTAVNTTTGQTVLPLHPMMASQHQLQHQQQGGSGNSQAVPYGSAATATSSKSVSASAPQELSSEQGAEQQVPQQKQQKSSEKKPGQQQTQQQQPSSSHPQQEQHTSAAGNTVSNASTTAPPSTTEQQQQQRENQPSS